MLRDGILFSQTQNNIPKTLYCNIFFLCVYLIGPLFLKILLTAETSALVYHALGLHFRETYAIVLLAGVFPFTI